MIPKKYTMISLIFTAIFVYDSLLHRHHPGLGVDGGSGFRGTRGRETKGEGGTTAELPRRRLREESLLHGYGWLETPSLRGQEHWSRSLPPTQLLCSLRNVLLVDYDPSSSSAPIFLSVYSHFMSIR